jgi:CRISPR-associated endonuclease/helicase Cas3
LAGVASLAKRLAELTGVHDLPAAAEAAGWLHDLGKYRREFQDFIRGIPPRGSKQHKEAGAAWAAKAGDVPVTFAILGHHHGIPDKDNAAKAVKGPDGLAVVSDVERLGTAECPELVSLQLVRRGEASASMELFSRVLLSCLVDADWADTGDHDRRMRGWPRFPAPPPLNPLDRLANLLAFIDQQAAISGQRNPKLASIRRRILDACRTAAGQLPGLFSLTVPTGGGKTLSGMAFALEHAAKHRLRRVIYVAPFTSILDQNADVIRRALGVNRADLALFEHQSLAEPQGLSLADAKQASAAARQAENWDSPIVVTTNVQFFESLFSNKPGRCRKLHNIARSVIILDECQTLPPDLVMPTCQMLRQLTADLGCTVVLCTATQPAFNHDCLRDASHDHRLEATEIIPDGLDLFASLQRVRIHWPKRDECLTWTNVAERMRATTAALCIVNTKKAARRLFDELKHSSRAAYHLSTDMCPAHRLSVLAAVKRRLEAKKAVHVVSTQLIEAGVDIDFPSVFREMAPLESILQAAGRCNREGLIPAAGGLVTVFRSEEGQIPGGWYRLGRDVLEAEFLAAGREPRVEDAADVRSYFHHLYWKRSLDSRNIVGMRAGLKFESVAEAYHLIGEDTVPVVVATWREHAQEIETLLESVRDKPVRVNFRALAPFQVNMFRTELFRLPAGLVAPLSENMDLLVWRGAYDSQVGRTSDFQNLIEAI